jgi:peroxiredoxin Q/BCP
MVKTEVLVVTLNSSYSGYMKLYKLLFSIHLFVVSTYALASKVGANAPSFSLLDQNGETWNSEDYLNKKNILIFFYPAAMTGGCTKQVCSYRNDMKEWKTKDFEVIGISGDKPENLKLFSQAENLNFRLLSDINGDIAKAFGVPYQQGRIYSKVHSRRAFYIGKRDNRQEMDFYHI